MGTSSSAIFSGSSRFSQDFASVIDRSVAIASFPLRQLTNQKLTLNDRATSLSDLDGRFAALDTAVHNLQSSHASFSPVVSDPSILNVIAGTGAMEGSFSVEVVDLGSYTATMSKSGLVTVSNPSTQNISSAGSFTLTVNGTAFTVTPSSNTLDSLVRAINATAGANVRASIVNVGPSSAPDYRLSVQGTKLNADTIQLSDGTSDLLDSLSTGSNASYKVNGLTTAIQSDSRTVTLAPGVTAELLKVSAAGQATTVDVSLNTGGIRDALSSLADAYNAVVDALDKQHGKDGGSLTGLSIVSSLTGSLRHISSFAGAIDFGLELGKDGKLSLNAAKFDAATAGSPDAILDFLGDSTTGGFLKAASDELKLVEDPIKGSLKEAIQSTDKQLAAQDKLIQASQDRVDQIKQQLQERMAAADALVASLEQQVNYMTNLFESMKLNIRSMQ